MNIFPVPTAANRNKSRALRVALLASTALLVTGVSALAQDATWLATPNSDDYHDSANWSGGTMPTSSATFGASSITDLSISSSNVIGDWTFDVGAADYNFSFIGPYTLQFDGAGIVINDGSATIQSAAHIVFLNASTAGHAAFGNNGFLDFTGTSTAGDADIDNRRRLDFYGNSRAGNATIRGGGLLRFLDNSTADNATIFNTGEVRFIGNATAGNARLISNAGTSFGFSTSVGPDGDNRLSAGSIEGAGLYLLGTNELTVGSNNLSTELSGDISGVGGSLVKVGTGTLTLSGNASGLTGPSSIMGGALAVTGELGGALNVLSTGRLQGTGTVGSTTVAAGGTIAPGNPLGTLHIAGDYTQQAGSVYQVEIGPDGSSDLIDITGEARIEGGTVFALKAPGEYDLGTRYTILSAAGGVTGAFDALDQNAPFIDLLLAYDPGNVYLDVARNDVAFCDVTATANQCAVGIGAESAGAGNPIYDAIATISDASAARAAFDALSGEIHASTRTALVQDSQLIRDTVNDRVRAAFAAIDAAQTPVLAYGATGGNAAATAIGGALAPASAAPSAAWGSVFGSWGATDNDGNAATLAHATGGIVAGVDGFVAPDWRLGVMAGYSHSAFDADGRASSGSSDNYHIGLYGGTQQGALGLRAGAAYTWHDVATRRAVAFPGYADSLNAEYGAGTFQAFGELGYRIDAPGVSIEPFANLAYVNFRADGFTETGGAAALTSGGQSSGTMFTTLGVRASTDFDLGTARATARGMIGWRHAYDDVVPTSAHAFAGGDAFTVAGAPIAVDTAIVEAGLDFAISPAATFGLSYTGEFGGGSHDSSARANFSVRF